MIRSIILVAIAATVLLMTVRSLRAQRLKERYVLLFLITGLPFLVLAVWPDGIVVISQLLKIEKPTFLVLCVTTYFILTTFALLSIVSVQERKITNLAQIMGLMTQQREAEINSQADAAGDTTRQSFQHSNDE
jgi:hypothetical protein